jgi:hypothetical protein
MNGVMHAPVVDRVRANTWPPLNERLDNEAQFRLREAADSASSDDLTTRITQLDYEWDFDRTLEAEASVMGLRLVSHSAWLSINAFWWSPVLSRRCSSCMPRMGGTHCYRSFVVSVFELKTRLTASVTD